MNASAQSICVAALLALGAGAALATPQLKTEAYAFKAHNGETIAAELGTFDVQENRSDPDSRRITLKFVRFKSTSANPGSPIVYLAGGPGGSGIGTARGTRFPLFLAMREFGDVIAFDQRGTGMSGFEELDCDDRYRIPFDEPLDRTKAAGIISAVTKDCMDRLRESGVDVSAYNTKESAADLNDLRLALGAEKLTLWGISYGTHLALATMKYHGEFIDRAILAGLEGLHHSWKLPSDQQELMQEIARLAKNDPAVHAVVPDLLASIQTLLDKLERQPQSVELVNPMHEMTLNVAVGKFDLQFALATMLRGPAMFAAMPDAISRLEQGDWLELALASAQRRMGEGTHSMSAAMDCASGATAAWMARIAREAQTTLLGDAINYPFPELCENLGVQDLGDAFRAPVKSDTPTLLISGTLDGRTPVKNGEEIERNLERVEHVVIEGAGHSDPLFLSSPEILQAMQAFMRGDPVRSKRIQLPPVEFIAPRRVVALGEDDLSKFVGTYRISDGDDRVVTKAGDLLWTKRGRSRPLPIRPTSDNAFFYVGSATHLEFEVGADGSVTGMTVFQEGSPAGEYAKKTK